jgi:hypothetical protein
MDITNRAWVIRYLENGETKYFKISEVTKNG